MSKDRFLTSRPTRLSRRKFCGSGVAALSVGIPVVDALARVSRAVPGSTRASIPSLDELATKWLDCAQLAHMPSMHNFHEMAACAPDLVAVNVLPGHRIYKASGPRWFIYNTLPICRMSINGQSPDAAYCQWTAYEARRRVKTGRDRDRFYDSPCVRSQCHPACRVERSTLS